MRQKRVNWILVVFLLAGMAAFLNFPVTTLQGKNYVWRTYKIPLYLKLLDFFDRYYNYRVLVKRIVGDSAVQQEKVMKIFYWVHENMEKPPAGVPIIDDHIWYTIVRGYAADDQSQDVFATLCNIAGEEAYFAMIPGSGSKDKLVLSFVRLGKSWYAFDAFRSTYFRNNSGELAAIGGGQGFNAISLEPNERFDYGPYLKNIVIPDNSAISRPGLQSPLRRLMYEIKKRLH